MSSTLKSIQLYGKFGPNPPKVAIILSELNLPHEIIPINFGDIKKPDFLALNPNGRLPAIHDPNTGLTLWESGAIILYIIEKYDTERKLSFAPGSNEDFLAKQWLMFQMSGQGPYYGQAVWFITYHPERVESAVGRYFKEVHRVTDLLEATLKKREEEGDGGEDGPWLVGGKMSYADLAFLSWQLLSEKVYPKDKFDPEGWPGVKSWMERMCKREAVRKVVEEQIWNT